MNTANLNVGFIGLGDQGLPMAVAIAEGGFALHVWARRPTSLEGLGDVVHVAHASIEELAAASDIVALCVSTDEDVIALLEGGLLARLKQGSIVVNHGTGIPARAIEMARLCAAAGVEFLDAPVSGGHAGAVDRTLSTMVGGSATAYETCEPVFRSFSSHVAHLGAAGAGELAKLLNNTLMMMNHANVADILELATELRVDPVALADILKTGSGSSTALEILPTGTQGLPADVVEHAKDVLILDMELFERAMEDFEVDTEGVTARALSGAMRVPNNIRILNP
jgi:3-hydroxyisobutyrate dehydrogenase-like beta-hydroxyacid dehydrogenase